MEKRKAFTLIELLVVIAIIALLMAIIMPALGKAKELAQKVICRSNIRQQCLGATLYSNEYDSMVPTVEDCGNWLWDVSFWTTNQISAYAGFDDNDIFYCPANRFKKADDARFWQFTWRTGWPSDLSQPISIRDESGLSIVQQQMHFRVMPVLYMFWKSDSPTGQTPPVLPVTNEKGKWIKKLSNAQSSGSTIMVMDNIISRDNGMNFFDIRTGGVWNDYGIPDNSNHKSNKTAAGTNYYLPSGANVGYADGHVDWKNAGNYNSSTKSFEGIRHRVTTYDVWFWW